MGTSFIPNKFCQGVFGKESSMPRFLPLLEELLPPLDGSPVSRRESNECRAIRLSLLMVVTVIHQQGFLEEFRPIPGGHTADLQWLHLHLEPLARCSPTIRKLRRIFDLRLYGHEWYHETQVRRNLKRLAQDAVLLASVIEATRSSPPPRPSPGSPGRGRGR